MASRDRAALLAELARIVGERQLFDAPHDIGRYLEDGRGGGDAQALAIVRPANADEVAAVMRLANVRQVRVVVQGGRTGLLGAGLPDASGEQLVISLDRLVQRIDVDPMNRTATVDAGVTLSALNDAAKHHSLMFPIDLGADPTIGGMVATNTGGARLVRYGDMRRNLLALDLVCADRDATRLQLGKPLWKNNAGLDLRQLFVGSGGALGVIVGATVALQPLPANRITALVALDDPAVALPVLQALEGDLGMLLTAFEGMSQAAMSAAFAHVGGLRNPFAGAVPAYALLVELSAGAAMGAGQLEELLARALERFMPGDGRAIADIVIDHGDRLWSIRHAIPEGLRARGHVIACDVAVRRGDVMRFRAAATARLAIAAPGLRVHDFGHIGDGGLHFNMVWPRERGPLPRDLADRARELVFLMAVEAFGGSFSAEHGVGPRNADWYARFTTPTERALAGSVQRLVAPRALGRIDFGPG